MNVSFASCLLLVLFALAVAAADKAFAACPALDPPYGNTITVSTTTELEEAVSTATPGTTILLLDGTYVLTSGLWFREPRVVLRSVSGDPSSVVLDQEYNEGFSALNVQASDVMIAELTVRRSWYHGIHVTPNRSHVLRPRFYRVLLEENAQQQLKVNSDESDTYYVDEGEITCSRMSLSSRGRSNVRDNCYTGGIDAHRARGWQVRANLFEGIYCMSGLAEHAIHFWVESAETLIESNTILNCARGIGLGMGESHRNTRHYDGLCSSSRTSGGYVGHWEGIVRNNVIAADDSSLFASEYEFDCGICLEQNCGSSVVHNSIWSEEEPFQSIDLRYPNTNGLVANNIASHSIGSRDGAMPILEQNSDNVGSEPFKCPLADGTGDFHLTSPNRGASLPPGLCDVDFSGAQRNDFTVGAYEIILSPGCY